MNQRSSYNDNMECIGKFSRRDIPELYDWLHRHGMDTHPPLKVCQDATYVAKLIKSIIPEAVDVYNYPHSNNVPHCLKNWKKLHKQALTIVFQIDLDSKSRTNFACGNMKHFDRLLYAIKKRSELFGYERYEASAGERHKKSLMFLKPRSEHANSVHRNISFATKVVLIDQRRQEIRKRQKYLIHKFVISMFRCIVITLLIFGVWSNYTNHL